MHIAVVVKHAVSIFHVRMYCVEERDSSYESVWHTTWLLLRLNLKHVCGLILSVQISQSVQLTCESVDTDRTVRLHDGEPKQRDQDHSNKHFTGLATLLLILGNACSILYGLVGSVRISGFDESYVVHVYFFLHVKAVHVLREDRWLIYI